MALFFDSNRSAVMATITELRSWIERDIVRFGASVAYIEVAADFSFDFKFRFYTDTNRYTVVAKEGTRAKRGYLGCTSTCRKPRAGEDWNRGSDLADGPLDAATWHRILGDIVSYEMVKVHVPKATAEPVKAEITSR